MIEVSALGSGDARVLTNVAEGVFDRAPLPRLTEEFLKDDRHHIVVAIEDGIVVGFGSAVHYIHPDKSPELWINELGVTPTRQRQGLGTRLLNALFEIGRGLGCEEAWVLTERTNGPAVGLYTSSGGAETREETVMFSYQIGDVAAERSKAGRI